jgi:hypothetical protein
MNSTRSIAVSGIIAAVIAIALIGSVVGSGILNTKTTTPSTSVNVPQSQVTANTPTGSGTLAVLMTDPPTVPNGTTHVYITYSNLAIHISGDSNFSGWQLLNSSGQVDLMGIINVTQTIASVNIQSGVFDAMEFNISSAIVTFNGANYTADLVYQRHYLYVPITGGITIVNGQTSAAVLDLTPTILLLGTPANPTFAFIPDARAYTVPAQSIPSIPTTAFKIGVKQHVENSPWFQTLVNSWRFEITSVTLTPTSLSVSVTNTGNSSLVFRLVGVISTISLQGGMRPSMMMGAAATSDLFVVQNNATLVPINSTIRSQIADEVADGGYALPAHASVTFTYSGNILINRLQIGSSAQAVVPDNRYVVVVMASGFMAATATVAQSS